MSVSTMASQSCCLLLELHDRIRTSTRCRLTVVHCACHMRMAHAVNAADSVMQRTRRRHKRHPLVHLYTLTQAHVLEINKECRLKECRGEIRVQGLPSTLAIEAFIHRLACWTQQFVIVLSKR